MRRLRALAAFACALGVALAATAAPVRADTAIQASPVENQYPKQLVFAMRASAGAEITDVTLSYSLTGRGTSALGKPDDFKAGRSVDVRVTVATNSGAGFIPVGTEIAYHWEVTTADGQTTVGPETKYLYLPSGQDWAKVSNDFMEVWYHGDRAALANAYLKAGAETYDRIGKQLFNVALKVVPVRVVLFGDEKEMSAAQESRGTTFDSQTITCGTKYTENVLFMIPQACGSPDRTDTLRHEFGHILNALAGEGTLAKLPPWLDEGTAVYAQSSPGDYTDAFAAAVRARNVVPFAQLSEAQNNPRLVGVFYGQAYAMVKYLVDKAGPAKYAQFFATIKKGTRFDDALKQTYGFDLAGFETECLASLNLPARTPPTATAAPTQARQQQPTVAPTAQPLTTVKETGSGGTDGLSKTTIGIVAGAVLLLLLAVLALLLALMLQNQRRRPG
ncbi:MAG: hypothetical protein IT304_00220 [Dehalococcoidia bacterium]|nr:hypothetical protein [Dehalococcoidia bacterium]